MTLFQNTRIMVKTAGLDANTNKGAAIGAVPQECVAGLDGQGMVATEQWALKEMDIHVLRRKDICNTANMEDIQVLSSAFAI